MLFITSLFHNIICKKNLPLLSQYRPHTLFYRHFVTYIFFNIVTKDIWDICVLKNDCQKSKLLQVSPAKLFLVHVDITRNHILPPKIIFNYLHQNNIYKQFPLLYRQTTPYPPKFQVKLCNLLWHCFLYFFILNYLLYSVYHTKIACAKKSCIHSFQICILSPVVVTYKPLSKRPLVLQQ